MPSSPNADGTRFLLTIKAEAEAIQQFVDLLELEQAALTKGDTDALPGYAEQKIKLAVHLNSLSSQRNALLAKQGFESDKRGVDAWCSKHPNETNAQDTWSKVLVLASKARELNRINGELITMRMQYNEKALEALQGGKKSLDLYGPDGQSTSTGSRRINDTV